MPFISLFLLLAISSTPAAPLNVDADWSAFLAREDLLWNQQPKSWGDAAFIGNGLLGATIYSEGANLLQWDVGRSDVVDRHERLPIGRFVLVAPSTNAFAGTMRLDLWNAEATGKLAASDCTIAWRSFTHATEPVNVIEWTEQAGTGPAKIEFQHLPAVLPREDARNEPFDSNPPPVFGNNDSGQWCLQPLLRGGGYVVAWCKKDLTANHHLFFFTVDYAATGSPTATKALADLQAAANSGLSQLVQTHRSWWHAYYPQSFLSIPDSRMESFYWIQMYKLASATRADRPAMDLMGPWFRRTPWPAIWWNLNIQLTYWPVYAANRLSLGQSLTRLIDSHVTNLINNVPEPWREDSAAIGRSSSYDCVRSLKGAPGEERGDLTWALHDYWLQYRYSGDEDMLRTRLYPILKRAIAYYLHLLEPGADGKLHLPVSLSPEYPKTAPDTNYDLALLRWGLMTLLASNERLGLNDPMAEKWRNVLAHLTPYPVDPATGYMIGAGQPLAQSHRHFSHLLMVYPLHLVDPQSAADRPLIEKSLDHWQSMKSALRGYSFTGASAISSWLGRKQDVVPFLDEILDFRDGHAKTRFHVTGNTMYLEAGPVIETPLAAAASIQEIVLQSWSMEPFGTHLRVFPAVPDNWRDVAFDKMRAEGAFEVSAVRHDGKTKLVQITSLAGSPCRVTTGLAEPIAAAGPRSFALNTQADGDGNRVTTLDLRKGETVVLTSADEKLSPEDYTIRPVPPEANRVNFYGSAKD